MNRVQFLVGAVLVVLGVLPRAQSDTGTELGARIEAIRAEAEVPALGAALVTLDGVEGVWVSGTRRAGGEEKGATKEAAELLVAEHARRARGGGR